MSGHSLRGGAVWSACLGFPLGASLAAEAAPLRSLLPQCGERRLGLVDLSAKRGQIVRSRRGLELISKLPHPGLELRPVPLQLVGEVPQSALDLAELAGLRAIDPLDQSRHLTTHALDPLVDHGPLALEREGDVPQAALNPAEVPVGRLAGRRGNVGGGRPIAAAGSALLCPRLRF
jgi:hypothetical protein